MSIPKVSIIIPFYDVEKYIGRCIDSVMSQTFSDFECIIIDDESTDNSLEIAKKHIAYDNRFTIIKQKNSGIGGARNKGLLNVNGEYVCFLDSDDWWAENFLEIMTSKLTGAVCDVIVCSYSEVSENKIKKNTPTNLPEGIYNNISAAIAVMESPTVWNKLYKRDLWHNIYFPENIKSSEDLATLYKVMYKASKICYISDNLYNYFIRINSLTRNFSDKKIEDRLLSFDIMQKDITTNYPKIQRKNLNKLYYQHVILPTYFDITTSTDSLIIKRVNLRKFRVKLDNQYFNFKILLKLNFLNQYYKLMLIDFLTGMNLLLYAQKLKRNMDLNKIIVFTLSKIYTLLIHIFAILKKTDLKKIPIIINNRNRLEFLSALINSLEKRGYTNIIIIDNRSTFTPLLKYYESLSYKVIMLENNLGYRSLEQLPLYKEIRKNYFVYTDSDVVLDENCPDDFMNYFYEILKKNIWVTKVGFSLKIDDLPDYYEKKEQVIKWESQFYKDKSGRDFYASIDTTFALHKPYTLISTRGFFKMIRTGAPYVAKHMPWYNNSANLNDEEKFYIDNVEIGTHWSKGLELSEKNFLRRIFISLKK